MALYETLRPVMKLWYAYHLGNGSSVPKPWGSPSARAGAGGADRVLLLGNGPCHGWGVATHELALTGQLSRALSTRTGRGADVDYVGDERMNSATTLAWLGTADITRYDAIALVIGMNDAIRLTPLAQWSADLRRALDTLLAGFPGTVFVAGIQPVRSVRVYDNPLGAVAERHARLLTAAARTICAEYDRAEFFELGVPRFEADRPLGSPDAYRQWGEMIAEHLVPTLVESDRAGRDELATLAPTWNWAGGAEAMELSEAGGSPELQRITAEARERFGVQVATVSLLNGDRLWYAASGGSLPPSIPQELSHCRYTVEEDDTMIVPDSRKDPRFRDNPLLDLSHIVFYAGHPIKSRSGEAIGAFCLLGAWPKSADSVDVDALRDLALRAQTEMWKLEDPGESVREDELPASGATV